MELAHLEGVPGNEARVAFPVVASVAQNRDKAWSEALERLGEKLPADIASRLRSVQSWSAPELIIEDALELIRDINNADKHRFGVQVFVAPVLQQPVEATPVKVNEGFFDRLLPWMTMEISEPLPTGDYLLRVGVIPMVSVNNWTARLYELQLALHSDVARAFEFICSGQWPDDLVGSSLPEQADFVFRGFDIPNGRREAARAHGLSRPVRDGDE